jgi:hypothetical protein
VLFRERLWVPVAWWLLSALFAFSMLLAVGFYLGWVWGCVVALVCFALVGAIFVAASVEITVTGSQLRVGRAVIDVEYIGACTDLDAQGTRRRSGPEADARAYLVLRPYVSTAVEITIADPADPTPYWLVASRRPAALAAAVMAALGQHPSPAGH